MNRLVGVVCIDSRPAIWRHVARVAPLVVLACVLLGNVSGQEHAGESLSRNDAIEAGQRALLERGDLPWYDEKSDQLEPLALPPEPQLRRSSDWEWHTKPKPNSRGNSRLNLDWWEAFWRVIQWLVWIGLATFVAVLIYFWVNAVAERGRLSQELGAEETRLRREADLIEQLPFQVKRPTQDLLSEARQAYQTGDYRAAIVYLFSYQLVELDRHQWIRLSKGKTNRQYLFELQRHDRLRHLLTNTVVAFEDVYFGQYELDRDRFETCWNRLEEFNSLVQQSQLSGHGPSGLASTVVKVSVLLMVLGGCGRIEKLDTNYGRASGSGSQSINGVSVFAGMFEESGFQMSTWRRLSPKLERERVLVWAPDRYGPPNADEIGYLNTWLAEPGRTLIFIGRDYDGASDYWRDVLPRASAEQRMAIRNEVARSEAAQVRKRADESTESTCAWFTIKPGGESPPPHQLSGRWANNVDALQTRFSVNRYWELPATDKDSEWAGGLEGEPLLSADDRLVVGRVTRPTWSGSQILIVPNGSWLLNSRLVNHEHRRLAQRVIDECGVPDRVCFLESDEQGLEVSDRDSSPPLMLQVFTVYPANVLMLHVVFLGILYCFSVFPIFGRPQTLPIGNLSDFGKHVTAVGEMLEKGRDPGYARSLLEQHRDKT